MCFIFPIWFLSFENSKKNLSKNSFFVSGSKHFSLARYGVSQIVFLLLYRVYQSFRFSGSPPIESGRLNNNNNMYHSQVLTW